MLSSVTVPPELLQLTCGHDRTVALISTEFRARISSTRGTARYVERFPQVRRQFEGERISATLHVVAVATNAGCRGLALGRLES